MDNIFTNKRFEWIDAKVTLPEGFNEEFTPPFKVSIPVQRNWDQKKKRLLIIQEHVDVSDLKDGTLCSDHYGQLLTNMLFQAITYASKCAKVGPLSDFSIAVVPFQCFKSYHLDPKRQTISNRHFAKRVERIMERLEPTHIIVLGDVAAANLLKHEHVKEKRGWVFDYEREWGSFVACSTLDPADLTSVASNSAMDHAMDGEDEDDDEEDGGRDLYAKTNLLGHVFREMANMFTFDHVPNHRGLPYSVEHVTANPVLLTDIDEVEDLYAKLLAAPRFAYDTELCSLNRIDNKLLTMQFSLDDSVGFIVPVKHRQSNFAKGQNYQRVRDLTYELFCNPKIDPFGDRYVIGTNLQFDATMTRQQLGIPIIMLPFYDIQNGDFIFDENLSELDNYRGTSPAAFSLAAMSTRYGSTAYLYKEGFNKQDRANMEACDLEDKDTQDYMALDTQLPLAICDEQIRRARNCGYTKFMKMVIGQQSNNVHAGSCMEHHGVHLDLPYLKRQLRKDSEIHTILADSKKLLYATEMAEAANDLLCESKGISNDGGLFADMDVDMHVQLFNIDKPEHRQVLFNDVMELPASGGYGKVTRKSNGERTIKLNKFWQAEHKEIYEVSLFTRVNKVARLISSYLNSFYEKVTETDDGKVDGKLRPCFGFIYVKTGRGNSFKPSLQQTPTRSKEAKYVKRMFAVPFGFLKLKSDYSAQEVRQAANISLDPVMADPFNVARALRAEMFWADLSSDDMEKDIVNKVLKETPKLRRRIDGLKEHVASLVLELKKKGDIHLANIHRFFNKWVEKSDPLRDAIKGVVFGVIYGKGASTLGRDLWNQKVTELKDEIYGVKKVLKDDAEIEKGAKDKELSVEAYTEQLNEKLEARQDELDLVLADKTQMKGRALEIMEKMSVEWGKLYHWMDSMHESAATNLYVEAPHGRRRHLYGMLVPRNDIQSALCRRAVNAPVQGFSADIGHTSARLIDIHLHKFLRKFKLMDRNSPLVPHSVECAVHDALMQTVPYALILPALQILNWCMTTGVTRWFRDYYGHEWLSPPEIETEIGWHEANMGTWKYTQQSLRDIIRAGMQDQFDGGLYPEGTTVDDTFKTAMDVDPAIMAYLDDNYPWFDQP